VVAAGAKANIRKTDPSEHSVTSVVSDMKTDSIQGPLFGKCSRELAFNALILRSMDTSVEGTFV